VEIIASLSTIPKRLPTLITTLERLSEQEQSISETHLNIPYFNLRTGEHYSIPEEIRNFPKVKIFRTEDYGPITKIATTFRRLIGDQNTFIWQVDDDIDYPTHALRMLVEGMQIGNQKKIICRHGGALGSGFDFAPWWGKSEVDFMEGFGGILYPPSCILPNFFTLLDEVNEIEYLRLSDDIFLSMYFKFIGIPIFLYNPMSESNPYQLDNFSSSVLDPVSQPDQRENYRKAFNEMRRILDKQTHPK